MKSNLKISIILFLLLFSVCKKINAQSLDWQWAKSAGGSSGDVSYDIALDANGSSYITGAFNSPSITFGSTTLTKSGATTYSDLFIVKYDASGNVVWAKSVGGTNTVAGQSIAADANGNSYVTGNFSSNTVIFGNDTLTNVAGGGQMFIAKFDMNGIAVWARSAGGQGNEYGSHISVDQAGNSYVVGSFSSDTITFGSTILINADTSNTQDVFIVKYDSNGIALWAKSAGGTGNDNGAGVTSDAMGNSYITGSFYSPDITFAATVLTNTAPPQPDMFIVKYDSAGNVVWANSVNGIGYQLGRGITADAIGNIYVTGSFQNTITLGSTTLTSAGVGDVLIMKLDTNGNTVWAQSAGGIAQDEGFGVASDTIGNCYVTGNFNSAAITFGTTTITNSGAYDLFIVKYDTSGTAAWAKGAGGTFNDQSWGIAADESGNSYITGSFGSPTVAFDSITLSSAGSNDLFIAKLSSCQTTSSSDTVTACNNYTSPSGNYVWTASGVYLDTIPNASGCDSVITINLTINSTTSTQTITSCFNYTSPSGNYVWTTSGVYLDTIPNSVGCDSIITINLTVNTVDTSVTQTGNTLSANLAGMAYQWLDCNNGFSIISGATNQIFNPSSIGNYAVAITQNGCIDTSGCYAVIGVGINETSSSQHFIISPNPVNDLLVISYSSYSNKKSFITITDVRGKVVFKNTSPAPDGYRDTKTEINTRDFSTGVYFVQIQTTDFVETRKFIVKD